MEGVALRIETDPAVIVERLDGVVATDPVRHTILATVAEDVRGGTAGWCAWDGDAVAARSSGPVTVTGSWRDLDALAAVLAGLGDVSGLRGPVEVVDDLVARLGRPIRHCVAERLFRCDAVAPPNGVPGRARRAGAADRALLAAWREPFLVETFGRVPPGTDLTAWPDQVLRGGGAWLWEDGAGEVVAQAVARTSMAGAVRIGGVFTPPEHRGRGYGSAVTAALTADVLDRGDVPCLFTDLANPTSNKIYKQIGYRPVEDARAVWFV
jgi:RimJ/RimL family protein N-acetyltransferase